jgi:hypothetical protein
VFLACAAVGSDAEAALFAEPLWHNFSGPFKTDAYCSSLVIVSGDSTQRSQTGGSMSIMPFSRGWFLELK